MVKTSDKRGLVKIILIIFVVFLLILVGVAFYLYNFYVFKTVRVCIVNNVSNSNKTCQTQADCMNYIYEKQPGLKTQIESSPSFAQEKIRLIFSKAIFCEGTCKIKQIRGMNNLNGEMGVDSCLPGEEEIKVEIRGKEAIDFLQYTQTKT